MDLKQREKEFKRKRLKAFVIVMGYLFLGGCEDVIILPTCWDFLQTLGVTEEDWLGFTISIYSVVAAVAGMVGGRLADKYHNHTKAIIFWSIIFRSIGNLQYMLGLSVWNILISRMLCGIGAAAGTSLIAEVCRTTTAEERRTFLSMVTAAFQIGILIGPALQMIISYFDFRLFGFAINPLNAPGLFMGILWLFYWIATAVLFSNLTQEFREIEHQKNETSSGRQNVETLEEISKNGDSLSTKPKDIYSLYLHEFLTDSYVFLLWIALTIYFQQVALETVFPVITEYYFGFSVHQITLIYWSGCLEALTAFIGVAFLGKYIRESTLLVAGLFLMVTAHVWLICVMPIFEKGNPTHVVYFLVGTFLFYLGGPISNVGSAALASKVLSNETQGLGQGFRRMMCYIGLIFGPTWAGSTVHNPRLFIGLTLSLLFVNVIMLTASFTTLRRAEDKILKASKAKQVTDDESSPLLSSIS